MYGFKAHRVLPTFAGVGLTPNTIHGDGERGVCLGRDRAERHGAGDETFDDFLGRLHFPDGHRLCGRFDFEQAAQCHQALILIIDERGVLFESCVAVGARGVLQLGDALRCPHVLLAAHPESILTTRIERVAIYGRVAIRLSMPTHRLFRDLGQARAFDARGRASEVFIHERAIEPDGLENLRAAIGLIGGDSHLGHHLQQSLGNTLGEALAGIGVGEIGGQLFLHRGQGFKREIGVEGLGTVPGEHSEVVHFARRSGLDYQANLCTQARAD